MHIYTVTLMAQCTVLVAASDADKAGLLAMEETPLDKFVIESGDQIHQIATEDMDQHLRHADHTIDL